MTRIYTVDEGAKRYRIFFEQGIRTCIPIPSPLHKHEHEEIHIAIHGKMTVTVENVEYELQEGDSIIIPRGAYHATLPCDECIHRFSFQADLEDCKLMKRHFPTDFILELYERLLVGDECINYYSFICSELAGAHFFKAKLESNYRFEIGNFFDKRHHENIGIEDLAQELHLSKMQTQRLVKLHTGKTFGENLRSYRIKVADYLLANTDMTNEEIATYVGYRSYSGYWKARIKEKGGK